MFWLGNYGLQLGRALGPTRIGLALAIAAAAALAMAPRPALANPARFVYELCDSALPRGGNPGLHFVANSGVPIGYFDNCATPGGSLGLQEWGHAEATLAALAVEVPPTPGGFVETETITGGAGNLGPGNDHSYIYEQPWPQNNAGESSHTFFVGRQPSPLGTGDGDFDLLLNCDGNYAPGCDAGPTIWARDIAATEVDPKPPTLSDLGGSLLDGGPLRGHQTLEAEAHDGGGGLSDLEVFVNGMGAAAPVAGKCSLTSVANRSYKGTVALSPTPCPSALKGSWNLDTEATPFHAGANEVQVCASDLATIGAPNTSCTPADVAVDNSCVDSPVGGGEALSAHFAGSKREIMAVNYGGEAEVAGRLLSAGGDPIREASLCVRMRTLGTGSRLLGVGTVRTDARGRYAYSVPPGPNREVQIGYRHDAHQISRSVRYRARVKPSLKLSPASLDNGQRVHLWGRLPAPRQARRVVIIQANVPGSKRWITFRKATSGKRGGYHASYRFSATTRRIRYRFRALVPRQAGYPWLQGHSRPTTVLVRG